MGEDPELAGVAREIVTRSEFQDWFGYGSPIEIGLSEQDLNDDGVPEFLIRVHHPGNCGSAGCVDTFMMFQRRESEWTELGYLYEVGDALYVGLTKKDGFRDLFTVKGGWQFRRIQWSAANGYTAGSEYE